MGAIRKIKGSLVNIDVDEYIGEFSYLFYDVYTGSLRIYDGTPGGLPIEKPLGELTNVAITTPASGQVLTYTAGEVWINQVPASGSTILTTLNVSTDTTLTVIQDVVLVTGETTITLPLASTITGKVFHIKNADGATITVTGTASETIDGHIAVLITEPRASITVVSDGVEWHII